MSVAVLCAAKTRYPVPVILLLLACEHDPVGATPKASRPVGTELLPGDTQGWTPCSDAPGLVLNEAVAANVEDRKSVV